MYSLSTITNVMNSYFPEPHASLMNGILFGIPLKTTKSFYENLKIAGLLHMVVLSGMNIGCIAGITEMFFHKFSKITLTLITILIIIFFTTLVRSEAPIIRAVFCTLSTSVALIAGKRRTAIYTLFLSYGFIALLWPSWRFSLSTFLSYGATLGIILHTSEKDCYNNGNQTLSEKITGYLKQEAQISLRAHLFTAPFIYYYFKQISLVSVVSNVLISFTIAPLMVFGFLTVIAGMIHRSLGLIPSLLCYGLLQYVIFIVTYISKIPFAMVRF